MPSQPSQKQLRWDWRYLDLASFIAGWSKDPKAVVGAVIVNSELGRIIAVGFNGFPTNITDDAHLLADKTRKLEMTIHAEQNALLFAGRDARGCDLYVVGKPICNTCAILAIQSGIKRVVAATPSPLSTSESAWDKKGLIACDLLKQAGKQFVAISDIGWKQPVIQSHEPKAIRALDALFQPESIVT